MAAGGIRENIFPDLVTGRVQNFHLFAACREKSPLDQPPVNHRNTLQQILRDTAFVEDGIHLDLAKCANQPIKHISISR